MQDWVYSMTRLVALQSCPKLKFSLYGKWDSRLSYSPLHILIPDLGVPDLGRIFIAIFPFCSDLCTNLKGFRNLTSTEPFLTIFASLKSPHSPLSNDAKIVKNGSVEVKF